MLGDAERSDDVALLALQALPVQSGPLQLRVDARPEVLADVRRSLRLWLEQAGASNEEAHSIVLAAGEACSNSIEHAYGPGDAELEIEARLEGGVVELTVRDFGRWRAPRGEDRGRGLEVMRATMDDVAIAHDDDGTVVQMSRRLASAAREPQPAIARPAPSAPRPADDVPVAPATSPAGDTSLRVSRDEDVVIAVLDGEIDMANAQDLFGRITAALDNRARGLVLDLSTTRYLDSSGLQALLDLNRRTRFVTRRRCGSWRWSARWTRCPCTPESRTR